MKKIFLLPALLIVIISVFAISFLSKKNDSQENEMRKFKVVYISALEDLDILLNFSAYKKIFEKNGVPVELMPVRKNTDTMLISGEADISVSGMPGSLFHFFNDKNPRWIGSVSGTSGFGVSRFSKQESDKIKKVAITRFGGMPQLMTVLALEEIGVNPENVEYVAIPDDATRIEMFKNEEIDFSIIRSKKYINELSAEYGFTTFEPTEILNNPILNHGIFVMQDVIEKYPNEIRGFSRAIEEGIEYMSKNKDEVVNYLQEQKEYSVEDAERAYADAIKVYETALVPNADIISKELDHIEKEYELGNPERDINEFIKVEF